MITIKKNQANDIVFTLSELTTLDPVYYFLELRSNQDFNTKALLLGVDLSTEPVRYNEFRVTEDINEDLDNAIVTLNGVTYDYFVWESTSTKFSDKVNIVESGKCVVPQDDTPTDTYETTENNYTYKPS